MSARVRPRQHASSDRRVLAVRAWLRHRARLAAAVAAGRLPPNVVDCAQGGAFAAGEQRALSDLLSHLDPHVGIADTLVRLRTASASLVVMAESADAPARSDVRAAVTASSREVSDWQAVFTAMTGPRATADTMQRRVGYRTTALAIFDLTSRLAGDGRLSRLDPTRVAAARAPVRE